MWKQVSGYENVYYVNEYGAIKNAKGKIIKPQTRKDGYLQYQLSLKGVRRMKKMHRLVAEVFVPNPQNLNVVNHKDGNKLNNYFKNLEWCTSAENNQHAWNIGLNHNTEKQRESARKTIRYARQSKLRKIAGGTK